MFIGSFLILIIVIVLGGGASLANLIMDHNQRSEKTHEKG